MIERMNERLGLSRSLPPRLAAVSRVERAENAGPAGALGARGRVIGCEIMRLVEHDGDLLHWYYEEGSSRAPS